MFGKVKKFHKKSQLHFIQEVLMGLQNCTLIGLLSTTEKLIIYLHVTEFYLIMKVPSEEKHLLQKK